MNDGQAFDHVKKLFEDKRDYFIEMKAITENAVAVVTSGSNVEAQADAYVSMVNKRERILKKIDAIDEALKGSEYFEVSCNEIFSNIKEEMKKIIRDILIMEEKNKVEGTRIKNWFAMKIKDLRTSKEVSVAYNRDAFYSGVSRFDSKN